jgi:murein DD-endopeptidase MepM/ murein hydrolase activator NlpD
LHETDANFQNTNGTFSEKRRRLFRLIIIACLYIALIIEFTPHFGEKARLSQQEQGSDAIDDGIGGWTILNEAVFEGVDSPDWSLEAESLALESISKPRTLLYDTYSIQKNDFIGNLAEKFGLNDDTIMSLNGIKNARLIQIGQVLRIPNQDGILYAVKKGDTLDAIAEKYKSDAVAIRFVNELFTDEALPGTTVFIPGARLDWMERQEINGDLFIWPVTGRITSPYGYREWPFGGGRQFHTGIDIGAGMGTPVRAAMSGRVSAAGWDRVLGNYIMISHHSGYRTMYGHLSVIRVKTGAYVGTGERIGDVGSTGVSTGPHLHFTVYKNGALMNPRLLLK